MSISGTLCIAANILKDALCDILLCVKGDAVKQFWLVQPAVKKVDKSVTKYAIFFPGDTPSLSISPCFVSSHRNDS